jgi:hypothetical protein
MKVRIVLSLIACIGMSSLQAAFNSPSKTNAQEDIRDMTPSVSHKIYSLKPVLFDNAESKVKSFPGFVAQDVKKLFPDLVTISHGEPHIAYNALLAVAIKEIQNHEKELEKLKAEIALLKLSLKRNDFPI